MKSAKQIQSEAGAVGEPGVNVDFIRRVGSEVVTAFQGAGNGGHKEEAMLLLANFVAGNDLEGDTRFAAQFSYNGSERGFMLAIASAFSENPWFVRVFFEAYEVYLQHGKTEDGI